MVGGAATAPDVTLENARFRLVIGGDAIAKSLVVKATGAEMLDTREPLPAFSVTQDRPFNNEVKLTFSNKQTTFRADRVRREGDLLRVGFELISYEALIRVTEAPDYLAFELVDFDLGPRGANHLQMTYPPVRSLRFLALPVKDRTQFGDWMNTSWDDSSALALMAAEPYTWADNERRHGFHILYADAHRSLRLRGARAALVAAGTGSFLDAVGAMERGLGLPLGVESRRDADSINRSIYWTSQVNPSNVDEHIAVAKRGGLGLMLIYYPALCTGAQGDRGYGGIADYELSDAYPEGLKSLREMLAKIKAAGIVPGLHVLQTFIGLKSHYVTPVADPRLNLTRHFTLARPLDAAQGGDLFVQEDPSNSPTNTLSRILRFGGELLSYEGFVTERPFRFTGVRRGHCGTTTTTHPRGEIGGILDVCEYGGYSCYIDQESDLQDEIAAKIARLYDAGFEFMYCDGSEGVNVPQGIHVPNAQYRVWKLLKRKPRFVEGAAKGHFGWHFMAGANAFDVFPPEIFKEMIVRWPQYEAPIMRADFTRIDFGWWGIYLPGRKLRDGTVTIGTQPDMWEFGTSRAAAWDCPAAIQFNLSVLNLHPRRDDLLEVMRRWEDVRVRRWLTPQMKEALKSSTQEHHLYLNAKGEYELHEIEMLPAPSQAKNARGFIFERGGRRVIACWHMNGSGELSIDLCSPMRVPLAGLRYLETDLPAARAKAAWAAATLAP